MTHDAPDSSVESQNSDSPSPQSDGSPEPQSDDSPSPQSDDSPEPQSDDSPSPQSDDSPSPKNDDAEGSQSAPDDDDLPRSALQGARTLALGNGFSCALRDKKVYCWGTATDSGRLGDGSTDSRWYAKPIPALNNKGPVLSLYSRLDSGSVCALLENDEIYCWGDNQWAQLGRGSITTQTTVGKVTVTPSEKRVKFVIPGEEGRVFSVINEGLYMWGQCHNATSGLSADGGSSDCQTEGSTKISKQASVLPKFPENSSVSYISHADRGACALANGEVHCWDKTKLGSSDDDVTPKQVDGLSSVTQVEVGIDNFACALTEGGVKCWGSNERGQLGIGQGSSAPGFVSTPGWVKNLEKGAGVKRIAVAHSTVCALMDNGLVKCWGSNQYGELGSYVDASAKESILREPTNVRYIESNMGTRDIASSRHHFCASFENQSVKCWGANAKGQLGADDENDPERQSNYQGFPIDVVFSRKTATDQVPRSCAEIKNNNPSAADGIFTIDPDGDGSVAAFDVYCLNSFGKGGWTLVVDQRKDVISEGILSTEKIRGIGGKQSQQLVTCKKKDFNQWVKSPTTLKKWVSNEYNALPGDWDFWGNDVYCGEADEIQELRSKYGFACSNGSGPEWKIYPGYENGVHINDGEDVYGFPQDDCRGHNPAVFYIFIR